MVSMLASGAVDHGFIGGVMVSMLTSGTVDHGFIGGVMVSMGSSPDQVQPKTIKFVFVCFSANHAAIKRKSKDFFARNQDNVSEWSKMFIHGLMFQ
jgi:hypothetical protein